MEGDDQNLPADDTSLFFLRRTPGVWVRLACLFGRRNHRGIERGRLSLAPSGGSDPDRSGLCLDFNSGRDDGHPRDGIAKTVGESPVSLEERSGRAMMKGR